MQKQLIHIQFISPWKLEEKICKLRKVLVIQRNKEKMNPTLSLPALSKVSPSSDNAIEVMVEWCPSRVAIHFLVIRSQTFIVPSSLPEKSW